MRAPVSASRRRADRVTVRLDGWRIERRGEQYRARMTAEDFGLDSTSTHAAAAAERRARLQPERPAARSQASYYYSVPQLRVAGRSSAPASASVTGDAWLDHEWSSAVSRRPQAVGWDWIGINLEDDGALMAFRIRDRAGRTRWAGGTLRRPDGTQQVRAGEIAFEPGRRWRSPRTGFEYPVGVSCARRRAARVRRRAADGRPESDTRGSSTGAVYWEGAVGWARPTAG